MALFSSSRPGIRGRVLVKFPARVQGTNGDTVTKTNGVYTFQPAYGSLTALASVSSGDMDNIFLRTYNSLTGSYARVGLDVLLTSVAAGLDATLVSISAANPTTDQGIYFTAVETAAVYSLTAGGRALAGTAGATDTLPYYTSTTAASTTSLTSFGRSLIDDANAAAGRTTLGLVIGTDVQAFDANLTSLALLATAADKIAYTTGVDTWAETAISAFGRSLIDDAAATNARTTLGLAIGTDVQAFDATLTSIALLGTAGDRIAYTTGVDTWAETPLTSFGRTLIDDADATAAKTTLGLTIGTNVQAYDADLDALAANSTDGFWAHTGAGTGAARTLTASTGITVTNGNGVSGNPTVALAAAAAYTFKGNATGGSAAPTDLTIAGLTHKVSPTSADLIILADQAASSSFAYCTLAEAIAGVSAGVTTLNGLAGALSIAGAGGLSVGAAGSTVTVTLNQAPIVNSLSGDVACNDIGLYFDGPSVAQGSTGTWFASGTVTVTDTGAATSYAVKLWDGTNLIASAYVKTNAAAQPTTVSLSGHRAAPAGNLRISVKADRTDASIVFNSSGNSKDSTITAFRIA